MADGTKPLGCYMLSLKQFPSTVYYVANNENAFRILGYLAAERNDFTLDFDSVDDFYKSIEQHGYMSTISTPWISVFEDVADAETYAKECNAKYTIHEVNSSEWYSTGVVVVNAPDLQRTGSGKLRSELLVHLKFPIDSVRCGMKKEKQEWHAREKARELLEEKERRTQTMKERKAQRMKDQRAESR